MAIFLPHRPIEMKSFATGSVQANLGIDAQTGRCIYSPGSLEYAQFYRAEFDPDLTQDQRNAARAEREAKEQQEVVQAVADAVTGKAPTGWVFFSHPDPNAASNISYPVKDGLQLAREENVETLLSHGFLRVTP